LSGRKVLPLIFPVSKSVGKHLVSPTVWKSFPNSRHFHWLRPSPPGVPNQMSNPFYLDWVPNFSHPRSNDQILDWILLWNRFHDPKAHDLKREILSSNQNFQLRKAKNRCVYPVNQSHAQKGRVLRAYCALCWLPEPAPFLASPWLWEISFAHQPPVVRSFVSRRDFRPPRAWVLAKDGQK
jgi:hypothetical protein